MTGQHIVKATNSEALKCDKKGKGDHAKANIYHNDEA